MTETLLSSEQTQEVLALIEDGFIFEGFAQEFLTARLGYEFMSSGGIKDRGIDGLQYINQTLKRNKIIFQMSIDKNTETKIIDTLDKLIKNEVEFSMLTYVTNSHVEHKDVLIDKVLDSYDKTLRIFDSKWIGDNTNYSQQTQHAINIFVRDKLTRYQRPGETTVINDNIGDPRLYVFLKQQISNRDKIDNLNDDLLDSLIIYSLKETDPDKGTLSSVEDIFNTVKELFDFEFGKLRSRINRRLKTLTRKPDRRVNHHVTMNKYCLPFETRLEILKNNANDTNLYDSFREESEKIIKENLKLEGVRVTDVSSLLNKVLEKVYYKQGLDFSNFLLNDGCGNSFSSNLEDIAREAVDSSNIIPKNRQSVKNGLIISIREIVYNGTDKSKQYLQSLSKTYLMFFLLKCEPKIVDYFSSVANGMKIYVCNSILVPALSERYLEPQNQRYWGLLKAAKSRGISLYINSDTLRGFRRVNKLMLI